MLEREAKYMEMKIKLVDIDAKRVFEPEFKEQFEPFRSKDI